MKLLDVIILYSKEDMCHDFEPEHFLVMDSNIKNFNLLSLKYGTLVFDITYNTIKKLEGDLSVHSDIEVIGNYQQG
jgi:hypothetical protein